MESKLIGPQPSVIPPQQPRDPYDFVVSGPSSDPPPITLANAAAVQAANTALALANKAAAKSLAKSNKSSTSSSPSLSAAVNLQQRSIKLTSGVIRSGATSTSSAGIVTSNAKIGALTAAALQPNTSSASSSTKRKRSGSSGSGTSNHHHQSQTQQQPISIAIPGFNSLSAANKVTPNAPGNKFNSNLLNRSDLNIVVSDSASASGNVMNGQLVSIPGVTHHIHLNALAPLDKANKNKAGGGMRGFPPPGRGALPVTALNSTASSLMGGNTAALLEQQRGGGLTLTMVTSASIFPVSTRNSSCHYGFILSIEVSHVGLNKALPNL